MQISYNKLWKLLINEDMTLMKLKNATGVSTASAAKLGKDGNITTNILLKLCKVLNCHIEVKRWTIKERLYARSYNS